MFFKKIQVTLIRVSVEGHSVGMWSTCISPAMFHLLGHRNSSACVPCLRRTLQSCGRNCHRDLPGGLAIKTLSFHAGGMGSIPGWGTKIPHVVQNGPEVKKKEERKKLLYYIFLYFSSQ